MGLVGATLLLLHSCSAQTLNLTEENIVTPFDTVQILTPDFTGTTTFDIQKLGAIQGDKESTSKAISEAIDKASNAGGGIVYIPEGEWLTKTIHFKSNVQLFLAEGSVLRFSGNPEDYLPAVQTTWEGMECFNYSPLIYAFNCKNIAISGSGTLKAEMDIWKVWFARPAAHLEGLKQLYDMAYQNKPVEERQMVRDDFNFRPHFIQFNRCENVRLEDVSINESPFWVIHPFMCKNVIIRNLNVYAHGHNNDGVDPEMTQNILIEDCIFDQGDDAIAIKSGRNHDAWRLNTPTKNLIIRNCTVKNGHQLIAIGSELSGGIENVFVDSCTVVEGAKLNHLVFIKTNERRGGYVKNIYVQNIQSGHIDQGILGIETDVLYQWKDLVPTYERKLTAISDVFLSHVHATDVKFVSHIAGQAEMPVNNVILKNVVADSIRGEAPFLHENINSFENLE